MNERRNNGLSKTSGEAREESSEESCKEKSEEESCKVKSPMKIFLSTGDAVLVDEGDFKWLSQWSWGKNNQGYARRTVRCKENPGGYRGIFMHRLILGCLEKRKLVIDHCNGNKLDNRRENLRIVTQAQNLQNSSARTAAHGRLFKGLKKSHNGKKWYAFITLNKKGVYLGTFATQEEAARAYDAAARKHFGAFAKLNFKEKSEEPFL